MSRAESIVRELVDDPALAWAVLSLAARVVFVAGPWTAEPARHLWARHNRSGGIVAWTSYPATARMLADADRRLLASRPQLSLVGAVPTEGEGIVEECGEEHPMGLADGLRWPRPEPTEIARCERPRGHLGACGGRMRDGRQGTASNAVERNERSTPAPRDPMDTP